AESANGSSSAARRRLQYARPRRSSAPQSARPRGPTRRRRPRARRQTRPRRKSRRPRGACASSTNPTAESDWTHKRIRARRPRLVPLVKGALGFVAVAAATAVGMYVGVTALNGGNRAADAAVHTTTPTAVEFAHDLADTANAYGAAHASG